MNKCYRSAFLFLYAILVTAFLGLYLGQRMMPQRHSTESASWHHILHDRLHITAEQDQKLKDIETRYTQRRQTFEQQMRVANQELAEAIKTEHTFSPRIREITDHIHHIMGELQKVTLEHLFEMRPILTAEQNQQLEQMVTDALYYQ